MIRKYNLLKLFFIISFLSFTLSQDTPCTGDDECLGLVEPCVENFVCNDETGFCEVGQYKLCENGVSCPQGEGCFSDETQCQTKTCQEDDSCFVQEYTFDCSQASANKCLTFYCSNGEGCVPLDYPCNDGMGCTLDECLDSAVGCTNTVIQNCTECFGIGCVSNDPCIESRCYYIDDDGQEKPWITDYNGRLRDSPQYEFFCKEFWVCSSSEATTTGTSIVTTGEETTEVSTTSDVTTQTTEVTSATSDITTQTIDVTSAPSTIQSSSIHNTIHHSSGHHTFHNTIHHSSGPSSSSHHSIGGHTIHHSSGPSSSGHHSIGGHTIHHSSGPSPSGNTIAPSTISNNDDICPHHYCYLQLREGFTCISKQFESECKPYILSEFF